MTRPARIPSDVNRPDKILGPFTARQVAILAATAGMLYLAWLALRPVIPLLVFLIAATPVGALAFLLAVGQRDGLSLDRLLLAALRHRLTRRPNRAFRASSRAHDPSRARSSDPAYGGDSDVPGWLSAGADLEPDATDPQRRSTQRRPSGFPARGVTAATSTTGDRGCGVGVVDLGADGLVVIAAVSTVNLSLRTPIEQDGLVDTFARYLHTLSAPVQILVRAIPFDLTAHLRHLRDHEHALPHPALAIAAAAHRAHLARLAHHSGEDELLTRQVLLVLREPTRTSTGPPGRGAEHRLLRRLEDAASLLAPLDVTVAPLSAQQATALLTSITNPDRSIAGNLDSRGHRPVRRHVAESSEARPARPARPADHDEFDEHEFIDAVEHGADLNNDNLDNYSDDGSDRETDNDTSFDIRSDAGIDGRGDPDDDEAWEGWEDEKDAADDGWGPNQWTETAHTSRQPRAARDRASAGRWVR